MKNNKTEIEYHDGYLICPRCRERLYPMDLEAYRLCPYCNEKFESTPEFEDFLLSPVLKRWVRAAYGQFPR